VFVRPKSSFGEHSITIDANVQSSVHRQPCGRLWMQFDDFAVQLYASQTKILENETAGWACLFEAFLRGSSPKSSTHTLAKFLAKMRQNLHFGRIHWANRTIYYKNYHSSAQSIANHPSHKSIPIHPIRVMLLFLVGLQYLSGSPEYTYHDSPRFVLDGWNQPPPARMKL